MKYKLSLLFFLINSAAVASNTTIIVPGDITNHPLPRLEKVKETQKIEKDRSITIDKKINLELKQVIITGNEAISQNELKSSYQEYIGKNIKSAEIKNIFYRINKIYKDKGYFLSFAIPADNFIVKDNLNIKIIEGGYRDVIVSESLKNNKLIAQYINKIKASKPITKEVLERNIELIKKIPGVTIAYANKPSETIEQNKIADLLIESDIRKVEASFTIDNSSRESIGPLNITSIFKFNNHFKNNEKIILALSTSDKIKKKFNTSLTFKQPLNDNSLLLSTTLSAGKMEFDTEKYISIEQTNFHRKINLFNDNLVAKDLMFNTELSYSPILLKKEKLTLTSGYSILDKKHHVKETDRKYHYRVGKLSLGGLYYTVDKYNGQNFLKATLFYGNKSLGSKSFSPKDSSNYKFLYLNTEYSRRDDFKNDIYLISIINAQYSKDKMLGSERFGFGGSNLGRGIETNELSGDIGLAASFELGKNLNLDKMFIQRSDLYTFIDSGVIKENLKGSKKMLATSFGFGTKVMLKDNITFNYEIAKPILHSSNAKVGKKVKHSFLVDYRLKF